MWTKEPVLKVEQINKSFDAQNVVQDISFYLNRGEIGCLLGPSGCGKTTLLRIIAGFESVDGGLVRINGKSVSMPGLTTPPEKRSVGIVFQDYALFPHLTVYQNVVFGLYDLPAQTRKNKASKLLDLMGLADSSKKYPHELSGGQQQRVALARALAPEPEILLLDEPFSNLDIILREKLTVEVRDILKELKTTALLVTHNQHEAFSVADRVGVLFSGKMQQWDSAYNIYHRPANIEVATFVGEGELISGNVVGPKQVQCSLGLLEGNLSLPCESGCSIDILIRPEDILHVENKNLAAKILHKSFRGPNILYLLELPSGEQVKALVSSHHNHRIGETIGVVPEVDNLIIFPHTQRQNLTAACAQ